MENITEFLDHLYKWPKDRIVGPEEDQEQFLVHWGYTIYRTYHGPRSDEQWLKLLKNITDGVGKGLTELEEADKEPAAVTVSTRCAFRSHYLGRINDGRRPACVSGRERGSADKGDSASQPGYFYLPVGGCSSATRS